MMIPQPLLDRAWAAYQKERLFNYGSPRESLEAALREVAPAIIEVGMDAAAPTETSDG